MKRYEYKMITINAGHLNQKKIQEKLDVNFNEWGKQGWDLIKMEPITSGGLFWQGANTDGFFIVFKREIQE